LSFRASFEPPQPMVIDGNFWNVFSYHQRRSEPTK
jgi:hypothetical protein